MDGEWVAPSSAKTLKVHNPSTRELIASVPDSDARDIDRAVAAARAAQPAWERMPADQRAGHIRARGSQAARAQDAAGAPHRG